MTTNNHTQPKHVLTQVRIVATALLKAPFEQGYSKEWNEALYELLRRLP